MFRTLQISLIKGHVNATTSRFFYLTTVALICVLSLQLTACGSTSTSQRPGQASPQITSPTPTSEETPTPTQASEETPTPTQPTIAPTLIPSDPTAFAVPHEGAPLLFPDDNGSFAPQPINLINKSNTDVKNCCAPLSWSAKVDSDWLSLSKNSDLLPAGGNQDVFVQVSIANLCSKTYFGTVTFTTDGSHHSVEIDLDLTSTSSVSPCVTQSPSPSPSPSPNPSPSPSS